MGAHVGPLPRETGVGEASVILLAAPHRPQQVGARALMFAAGARAGVAAVGLFATALLALAFAWLALAPPAFAWLLVFAVPWATADGLLGIVRAAAPAEFLGREGYGAVTGALAITATPARAAAPLVVAAMWQAQGSYAGAPWLLAAMGALAFAGYALAALDRRR